MHAFGTNKELQPIFDVVAQGRWGDNALVLSLPVLTRDSPRRVRSLLRTTFAGGLRGSALLDVLLITSELLTNALQHGSPPAVLVVIQWPDRTALAVHDVAPQMPNATADPRSGLAIIDKMSDGQWGFVADAAPGGGKWVWAYLGASPIDDPG